MDEEINIGKEIDIDAIRKISSNKENIDVSGINVKKLISKLKYYFPLQYQSIFHIYTYTLKTSIIGIAFVTAVTLAISTIIFLFILAGD